MSKNNYLIFKALYHTTQTLLGIFLISFFEIITSSVGVFLLIFGVLSLVKMHYTYQHDKKYPPHNIFYNNYPYFHNEEACI